MRSLRALLFLVALCCYNWPWGKSPWAPPWGPSDEHWGPPEGPRLGPITTFWGAEASTGFDGRFLGRKITTEALKQTAASRAPERNTLNDDDFLEDEEPLEIWGDITDRRCVCLS